MKLFIFLLLLSQNTLAQTSLYFVRHAEKQTKIGLKDPELTPIGQFRATNIANQLSKANIKHIYSTDTKRTKLTAKPLADFLGLEIELYDASKPVAFSQKLLKLKENALIVGHSNNTTQLVSLVSQGKPIYPIAENEYDNLYQVILLGDKVVVNWLKSIPSFMVVHQPHAVQMQKKEQKIYTNKEKDKEKK